MCICVCNYRGSKNKEKYLLYNQSSTALSTDLEYLTINNLTSAGKTFNEQDNRVLLLIFFFFFSEKSAICTNKIEILFALSYPVFTITGVRFFNRLKWIGTHFQKFRE